MAQSVHWVTRLLLKPRTTPRIRQGRIRGQAHNPIRARGIIESVLENEPAAHYIVLV